MQSTEPNCRTKAVNCFFSKPLLVIRTIKQFDTPNLYLSRGGKNNSALRDRQISIEWNFPLIWTLPEYESSVRFDPKDENNLLLGPYIQVIKDYLFAPQRRLFLGIVKMGWKGKKRRITTTDLIDWTLLLGFISLVIGLPYGSVRL